MKGQRSMLESPCHLRLWLSFLFAGNFFSKLCVCRVPAAYHAAILPHPSTEPRKKPSYFPLYWLVNRDPYNGLL